MHPDIVTRTAPSPTGYLHLGHAYSAGLAYARAVTGGGRFLLRIEDIDVTRCRPEYTEAILEDFAWLGLRWEQPVRCQSRHFPEYAAALDTLQQRGLLYPCFCTRRQIQTEIAAAGHAPHNLAHDLAPHGFEGQVYPGLCRSLSADERAARIAAGEPYAFRLDVAAACAQVPRWPLVWRDEAEGEQKVTPGLLTQGFGDVVLARKETPASYHLCVTHDDALQGVTLITRGADLFAATHLHRLLQALFGWPVPHYAHHQLLLDESGERLAKRRNAPRLRDLRDAGVTPDEVWQRAGIAPPPLSRQA